MRVDEETSRQRSRTQLALVRERQPDAVALARALSLAVRVETGLLRTTRLALGLPAAIESELWFSAIVTSAGPLGIALNPGVAELLRQELAADPAARDVAWRRLDGWHGLHPWSIRLEERINYLSAFSDVPVDEVEELLEAAVERLRAVSNDGRAVAGIARWMLAALARLPERARRTTAAHAAAIAAGAYLDGRAGDADAVSPEERARRLAWLGDRVGEEQLAVRLRPSGVILGGPLLRRGPSLTVPATEQLIVSMQWMEGDGERREEVRLRPGDQRYVEANATEIELRTLVGKGIVVRHAGVGRVLSRVKQVGRAFAVAPRMAVTSAAAIGEDPSSTVLYEPVDGKSIPARVVGIEGGVALLHLDRTAPAVMPVATHAEAQPAALIGARWHLAGSVEIGGIVATDRSSERPLLTLTQDRAPAPTEPVALSGAAVVLDEPWGAVIGVLQSISPDDNRLIATPITEVIEQFALHDSVLPALATGATLRVLGEAPDLTLQIFAAIDGSLREFTARISSPTDPQLAETPQRWTLPQDVGPFAKSYVNKFVGSTGSTGDQLRFAGAELWEASPSAFKQMYWNLVDAGARPRSLLIGGAAVDFPWELLVPARDRKEKEAPLGTECAVGVWPTDEDVVPPTTLPLTDSYVIAPGYDGPFPRPAGLEREVELVLRSFRGVRLEPARAAAIEEAFARSGASLIHFAGHATGAPGKYTLILEDEILTEHQLRTMPGFRTALETRRPLVFLNASGEEAFSSTDLVRQLLMMGAGAVIAPMWAVNDIVASAVAVQFYEEVARQPARPFAEILRDIRRRGLNSDIEASYMAYRFFGSPVAAAASPG